MHLYKAVSCDILSQRHIVTEHSKKKFDTLFLFLSFSLFILSSLDKVIQGLIYWSRPSHYSTALPTLLLPSLSIYKYVRVWGWLVKQNRYSLGKSTGGTETDSEGHRLIGPLTIRDVLLNFCYAEDLLNGIANLLERQWNDQKQAREAAGEFLSHKINFLLLKFDKLEDGQKQKDAVQLYSGLSVVVRAHSNCMSHITQILTKLQWCW